MHKSAWQWPPMANVSTAAIHSFSMPWPRVEPLGAELVDEAQSVRGSRHQDVRGKIADQLNLSFGHTAGDRHEWATQPLGAIVITEAAGEKAIAIGDVGHHACAPTGGADRPRHDLAPYGEIVAGIADHRGLAGRAGWSMNPRQLISRHGEKTERVAGSEICFGSEGKALEIL
jgi:hypothetical protein